MKKKVFITTIVIILVILFFLFLNKKDNTIIIFNNNLTLEYGNIAYISDYIDIKNGNLIDKEIIYNDIGKLNVKYNYFNSSNKKKSSLFILNVVDTTNPIVMLKDKLTLKKGYEDDVTQAVMCADNHDKNPICEVNGDYDINTIGEYPLTYIATDSSGNKTKIDFTLSIIDENNTYDNSYINFNDVIKKYKIDDTMIGIDVSKWQGNIDFEKVKKAGAEFVIIRIGYQDGFDGENILDKYFSDNIKGALDQELPIGIYFYSYATTKKEALNQASWILKQIKDYDITLPIIFDWESWSSFNNLNLSLFDITSIQETFLDKISKQGYKAARYGSINYLEKAFLDTKHSTWLAHYTDKTTYSDNYFMWQLCDNGKIDGINGFVDIDVMYK